jgi:hypothetical protein
VRRAARVDGNQQAIIDTLRALGCSVHDTSKLGGGFPDLCIAIDGHQTLLAEIKMPGGRLTPDQKRFHASWKGKVVILTSVVDAEVLVTYLRTGRLKRA